MTTPEIDQDKLTKANDIIQAHANGFSTWLMMEHGMKLGLFEAIRDHGPLTSTQLAARLDLNERWVREWLYQQASARVLSHEDGERFFLTPEMVLLVADESTPSTWVPSLEFGYLSAAALQQVPEAMRTGLGRSYDAYDATLLTALDHLLERQIPTQLEQALPALEGVVDKLTAGARAADVGCGSGSRTIAMARDYSKTEWRGYDNSLRALERAEQNLAGSELGNLSFHNADNEPLPSDHSLDLITFFDVIHDMAFPQEALDAAHGALRDDGTVLVYDLNVPEEITARFEVPWAPMLYGASMELCMSSSTSEEGGAGLGTFGLPPSLLEEMSRKAGFTRFRITNVDDLYQNYYEIRP